MITYRSYSSAETEKLGHKLARKILIGTSRNHTVVVGLSGELGSGKTTFIQGFFRGIGLRRNAVSPTFILMRKIQLKNSRFKNLFHIDVYRIKNSHEVIRLELNEIVKNPENIVLIEWADKIKKILPADTMWLRFKHGKKENQRVIHSNKNIF